MSCDRSATCADLARVLCDALVAKGALKVKPEFIRKDREAKICDYFEGVGLDGEKMHSFDNRGTLEMMVRKASQGEAWVQQVIDGLVDMLPEEVRNASKKMGMDEDTKAELEQAKAKTEQRRERQEREEGERADRGEGGKGNNRNPPRDRDDRGERGDRGDRGDRADRGDRGDRGGWDSRDQGRGNRGDREERRPWGDDNRGGGKGYNGNRDDREERGGWGDSGGKGSRKGGGTENMQCYNCDNIGHSSRDCPEPRKDTGKGKGKRYDRKAMICDNCGQAGHKSRDCPEPVDEERVKARLAAKADRERGD